MLDCKYINGGALILWETWTFRIILSNSTRTGLLNMNSSRNRDLKKIALPKNYKRKISIEATNTSCSYDYLQEI